MPTPNTLPPDDAGPARPGGGAPPAPVVSGGRCAHGGPRCMRQVHGAGCSGSSFSNADAAPVKRQVASGRLRAHAVDHSPLCPACTRCVSGCLRPRPRWRAHTACFPPSRCTHQVRPGGRRERGDGRAGRRRCGRRRPQRPPRVHEAHRRRAAGHARPGQRVCDGERRATSWARRCLWLQGACGARAGWYGGRQGSCCSPCGVPSTKSASPG